MIDVRRVSPCRDEIKEPIIIQEKITKKNGEVIMKKYVRGKVLGKGGFATCYEITEVDKNRVQAAKIISKASLTKKRALEKLLAEIKIHKSLQHENIVKFEHVFEDKENVYIILELCPNQTLKEFLKKKRRLSEAECAQYTIQILNALRYLHAKKIIHRDLKLGNLFLGKDNEIKVGDFGLAAKIEQDGERRRTICGTPNYIAPEVLDKKIGHSYEVDIWSLGVIIYTLLIGRPPFETNDTKATYRRILKANYAFPSNVPISEEAKELIKKILILDPAKRLTIDEILEDPFIKINLIAASLSQMNDKKSLAIPKINEPAIQTLPSERAMMQKTGSGMNLKDPLNTYKEIDENDVFIASSLRTTDKQVGSVNKLKTFDVKESEPMRITSPVSQGHNKGEPFISDVETYVTKWVDYSTKYGLGYLLSDGTAGMLFADNTKLTFASHGPMFEYISKNASTNQEVLSCYSTKSYPADLQKKVVLTKYFKNYLRGIDNDDDDDEKENIFHQQQQQQAGKRLTYMKKYMKTKYALLMRLSNKIVQVDFTDKTRIILDPIQQVVYYKNKEDQISQYPLFTALDTDYPEMVKRLQYTKDILAYYKTGNNNNKRIGETSERNQKETSEYNKYFQPNGPGPLRDGVPEKLPYMEAHAGFD